MNEETKELRESMVRSIRRSTEILELAANHPCFDADDRAVHEKQIDWARDQIAKIDAGVVWATRVSPTEGAPA